MPRNDQVTRQRHVLRLLESSPQHTVRSFGMESKVEGLTHGNDRNGTGGVNFRRRLPEGRKRVHPEA